MYPVPPGAQPTAGLVEVEPSMAWNPSVLSGIGIVDNILDLYTDTHSYLAAAGVHLQQRSHLGSRIVLL